MGVWCGGLAWLLAWAWGWGAFSAEPGAGLLCFVLGFGGVAGGADCLEVGFLVGAAVVPGLFVVYLCGGVLAVWAVYLAGVVVSVEYFLSEFGGYVAFGSV